jgi:subtilisin family serine protease
MLLTLAWLPAAARHVYAADTGFRAGQVVVKLNPAAGASIDDINATYGTSTLAVLPSDDGIYLLQTPPDTDAQAQAEKIGLDLRLEFAEPNFVGQAPEANPSGIRGFGGLDSAPFFSQYANDMLGLTQAHTFGSGAGAVVAVVDSGAALDHPALAGVLVPGYDFLDDDPTPADEANGLDDNGNGLVDEGWGHGTHIAGIIHLVAPQAKIMPLRALNSDGDGDLFAVARALEFAVRNGANVINLSLGTPSKSALIDNAIRDATLRGATVVAAAGNLNSETTQYPAGSQCALAVSSVGPTDIKSSFANYGGNIDFVAPGESIYSTFPGGGYVYWSGTSMATPFVAGQAALIHGNAPTFNARDIAMLIGGTARSVDKLNPAVSGELGAGQIRIGDSLSAIAAGAVHDSGRGLLSSSCVQ